MNETELKRLLETLYKNLNILREREAKYGGNAPVDLLNEIDDHQTAIALVESRIAGHISDEAFQEQLAPLNVTLHRGGARVIQIGTLVLPAVPLVVAALGLLALLGFVSYRTFSPALPTPVPGPTQMNGLFNVTVAEFGEEDAAGQVQSSANGQQLSRWIYDGLQLEFESLPLNLRQEFQPLVWHDSMDPAKIGVNIGIIPGDTPEARREAAAQLAGDIRADVVIYGNLELNQSSASFVPEFYVASLRGQADEIAGRHQLGAPIPVQLPIDLSGQAGRAINRKLIAQTRALSRFTLGLMYDLNGFSEDALKVFQQAIEELDWDESGGEEVFYYFKGRSALFLNEDEEAQMAFELAQAANPDYARPDIGLGSVYNKRAQCQLLDAAGQDTPTDQGYREVCQRKDGGAIAPCQLSPEECLNLVTEDIQQAIAHYQKAIALAGNSLEPQIEIIGRFALGTTYQLQGQMYFYLQDDQKAAMFFDKAVEEITPTLDSMEAAGQHRYLGQAYLALGTAYTQQAAIRQSQGDTAESIALHKKAREAYAHCLAQKEASPYDEILSQKVIEAGCKPYDQESARALITLEGGG